MLGDPASGTAVELLPEPRECPGHPRPDLPHVTMPVPRPAWISDGLLEETMEVWSEAYERTVGPEEAVEILVNVRRLGVAIQKAKRETKP